MMETAAAERKNVLYKFHSTIRDSESDVDEIQRGLLAPRKYINPKYFYNEDGQNLFDEICDSDDYYIARAEHEILAVHASEMADFIGGNLALIEPGCGNCFKVEYLLEQMRPQLYIPIDIAVPALKNSAQRLLQRFPWLNCMAVAADFSDLSFLSNLLPPLRRVFFYPGSTIGNFEPDDAVEFLKKLHRFTGVEGGLLIGVDQENNAEMLERAYNDRGGVTEQFNLNILQHINQICGSNFVPENFEHVAFYDSRKHRVEMHLRSLRGQIVEVGDAVISIKAGECIHTENSYKYSTQSFSALAAEAGFVRVKTWYDRKHSFSVHYLVVDEWLEQDSSAYGIIPMKYSKMKH